MRSSRILFVLLLLAATVLVSWRLLHRFDLQTSPPLAATPMKSRPAIARAAIDVKPVEVPVASLLVTPANPEMAATARVYAAHGSLRVPEVADPDSGGNRQILETMVMKTFAHASAAAPSRSPLSASSN